MIYIHIPFCRSFCTYCGFYSELAAVSCRDSNMEAYTAALVKEAQEKKTKIEQTNGINTLYIGGGTPSVLPLYLLEQIVNALPQRTYKEFTIELNPEDIVEKGLDYAKGLKSLGVNRVSMGIQSFDDGILKWMNRRHNAARAEQAFQLLREAGFDNISIDLIFGLSQLTAQMWEETLAKALGLCPEHISAYQLSADEGSELFMQIEKGRYKEAEEDSCREQYDILCAKLNAAGYRHYEVSNFAKPGFEAVHNSAYWQRLPYIGLGAAAHSFDGDCLRSWNTESLNGWTSESERLTEEDVRAEKIMLGLRTAAGLAETELRELCDPEVIDRLLSERALECFCEDTAGTKARRVHIKEEKFFVSDEILRELI